LSAYLAPTEIKAEQEPGKKAPAGKAEKAQA
jgi:hypothetical protein